MTKYQQKQQRRVNRISKKLYYQIFTQKVGLGTHKNNMVLRVDSKGNIGKMDTHYRKIVALDGSAWTNRYPIIITNTSPSVFENQHYQRCPKGIKPILVFQNGIVDNRPTCTKCKKIHSGKATWCKECKASLKAEYRKSDGYQVSNDRRARKKNLTRDNSITRKTIRTMLLNQFELCNICDIDISETKHIDHIKPLGKGGSHVIANIQLLCPSCNLTKSDTWDGISWC